MSRKAEYKAERRGIYYFDKNKKCISSVFYEAHAKKKLKEKEEFKNKIITDNDVKEYLIENSTGDYNNHKRDYRRSMIELYRCANNISKDVNIDFNDLPEIPFKNDYIRAYIVAVLSENSSKCDSFMNKIKYGNFEDITIDDKIKFIESIANEITLIDNYEIKEDFLMCLKSRIFDEISEVINGQTIIDEYCELCKTTTFDDYDNSKFEKQVNKMIDDYIDNQKENSKELIKLKRNLHKYFSKDHYTETKKSIVQTKFMGVFIDLFNERQELNDLYDYITKEIQNTLNDLYLYKYGNNIPVPACFLKKEFIDDNFFGLTVNNDTAFKFGINDRCNFLEALKSGIKATIEDWKNFVKEEIKSNY